MPDLTVLLIVTDEKSGEVVNDGDTVTDFRGDTARLIKATRARVPGKSGKVLVELPGTSDPYRDGRPIRMEYYDKVFDLHVAGLLSCGCDHLTTWEHGHRDGCAHALPTGQ